MSDGLLETLAVPPVAGRWFNDADQDPRGAKSVMLSYGYWQRRFGGDRSVIGRTIQVDSQPRTIVGVMPQWISGGGSAVRFAGAAGLRPDACKCSPGFAYQSVGRLKPGVVDRDGQRGCAAADRSVDGLVDERAGQRPALVPELEDHAGARAAEKQQVIGNVASMLWVVMATIGLVLLIACTNLANLLLVRAEARQQELSIRAALGAGRLRIARELLLESVTLGLGGGALAVAVAYGGCGPAGTDGPGQICRG